MSILWGSVVLVEPQSAAAAASPTLDCEASGVMQVQEQVAYWLRPPLSQWADTIQATGICTSGTTTETVVLSVMGVFAPAVCTAGLPDLVTFFQDPVTEVLTNPVTHAQQTVNDVWTSPGNGGYPAGVNFAGVQQLFPGPMVFEGTATIPSVGLMTTSAADCSLIQPQSGPYVVEQGNLPVSLTWTPI
jgi:hypothetical protein